MASTRPSKSLIAGLTVASLVHALALAWCAAVRIGGDVVSFEFHGDSIVVQAAMVASAGDRQPVVEIEEEVEPTVVVEPDAVRIADRRFVRESSRVDLERLAPPELPAEQAAVQPAAVVPSRPAASPSDRRPEPMASAKPPRRRPRTSVPRPSSLAALPQRAGTRSARLPDIIFNPPPSYPRSAIEAGIEGVVRLVVTIRRDGTVSDVRVAAGSGHAVLDGAAVAALRQWRARGWEDGPETVEVELPIRFRIPR